MPKIKGQMSFISKKLSLLLLLCSWCIALAIIFALHYALAGPKLGVIYDTLLNLRIPPPVSREILLIETDELVEPGDMFTVLMTLSEMDAAELIVEVPLLGSGSGMAESGAEFSFRINDEFSLVGKNIRSLFDAIRLGLVGPLESPEYVDSLIELTDRGRDRLNAAITKQDEAGFELSARAEKIFGRTLRAADLRPLYSAEIPWYSKPVPDRDGQLRRIAPIIVTETETEHIVYHALKPRWRTSNIEHDEAGSSLVNTFLSQGEEHTRRFPLDRDGNILIEKQLPLQDKGFRGLTLNHFREYDQVYKAMARLLKDVESLGVYTETIPERVPLILCEYAESLKDELLESPSLIGRRAWVQARAEYLEALDDFLYGTSELTLVNGYEELIAHEGLDDEGIAALIRMRDELIEAFYRMRNMHRELIGKRALFAEELPTALCIMGPSITSNGTGIPESSALLANTLLSGNCIKPGESRTIIIFSATAACIALLCIHALGPSVILILGSALSLLCGTGFSAYFIIKGYWIDPLIPMTACLAGTLFLALSRFCISYSRKLRFRLAYIGLVNTKMFKRLMRKGRPLLTETLCSHAVIIAVKNHGMAVTEDGATAEESVAASKLFQQEFSDVFKRAGALILGFENDTALACFGSPVERICGEEILHPAARAISCVRKIMNKSEYDAWRFGIESGECAFSRSAVNVYTANGRPVVRARIFVSLTSRYKVRAIIGESAREDGNIPVKKLASFSGESFYELLGG